ncbi:MAG: ABC transporter permease [Beutenbergiaceae bacterium]
MTAATVSHRAVTRGGALTGTGTLLRFMLRRDRIRFFGWTLGLPLFMGYFVQALQVVYADEASLQAIAPLIGSPVGALFGGPRYGMDDPTLEHFLVGLYGAYIIIGAGLMSLLTIIRHTRVEEQAGRAELVRADVVGRHAQLTAALVLTVVMNAVVVVLIGGLMSAQGFAATGSWLFAASVGAVGWTFAGIAATTAQLSAFSRSAAGMAGGVLGASFALRALGDMTSEHGNAISWLSPIGWAQQTAPFTLDRWWPLGISLVVGAVMTALGYRLAEHRDLGAGLVPPRPGSAYAAGWLASPLALSLRLQRGSLIGWSLALLAAGGAYGFFTGPAVDVFNEGAPPQFQAFLGDGAMLDGFLNILALTMGLTVAIYVVLAAAGIRHEETVGRAEPVLATGVSRVGWLGSQVLVIAVIAGWLLIVGGGALGVGAAISTGESELFGETILAHLIQIPAVWVVLGIAVLLYGALPRALGAVWVVVGLSLLIGFFGPMLDLPEFASWLIPFGHVGDYPGEAISGGAVAALTGLGAMLVAAGLAAFRRRDILGTG